MFSRRFASSAAAAKSTPPSSFPTTIPQTTPTPSITTTTVQKKPILCATMPWNDYFRQRVLRNRYRPLFGLPSALAGAGYIITSVPFNPFEPMLGVDPPIIMTLSSLAAALGSYFAGAFAGQAAWRLVHGQMARRMDVMDRLFYAKIKAYRAERGQSPYVRTLSGYGTQFSKLLMRHGTRSDKDAAMKLDFYGEKVGSVSDYRIWLRRQLQTSRDQLGADAPKVRGVVVRA